MREVLAERDIRTPTFASFDVSQEARDARISNASATQAAIELAKDDAVEAICTNLRTLDALEAVEKAAGKPALSSTQVLA